MAALPGADDDALLFPIPELRARLTTGDHASTVRRFREALDWGMQQLYTLFGEGAAATTLVHARARFIDEILRRAWEYLLPEAQGGIALIAVGGYGRRELMPHSDIDLLFLAQPRALPRHQHAMGRFHAFLWDIGLDVGSSTRSVKDCAHIATEDVTVMTNLVEARLLCGDPALMEQLEQALVPTRIWPVDAFYRAKLAEQEQRHHKYDDTGYRLEPNVKEGPGGLRDIQTVGWVAKRHFGGETLGSLRDHGFLTGVEYHELIAGQDFLWRIRFVLHMLAGRHEDRLLFDYQTRVAHLFGYEDPIPNRAVEQFMQLYYRTIKVLSCLNDMLLQLFDEAILQRHTTVIPVALNDRFEIRGNTIQVRDKEIFKRDPVALLELFALMQRTPSIAGIRARTLRLVRRDLPLLNDEARRDPRARKLFVEMFRYGQGLTRTLRRMNRYGVLGQYLPLFGHIVGLMQYDLFHTLTVDEHSLQVVRNLRRLAEPRFADELPFPSELFKRIDRPELLYMAGFLHDLAKGGGGDHSQAGADNAVHFCTSHGLPVADGRRVAWLVRNHLLMSLTAQRKDISDPDVVSVFAAQVGTQSRLDDLYLLTVADIRATNPALWNAWRDSLLRELYHATRRALERGLDNPLHETELLAEQRRAVDVMLTADGFDPSAIESLWPRFGNDYYLRHTPRELMWQLRAIATTSSQDLPLILVEVLEDRGTSIFVYMRDRDHLFTLTAGVLARLGLSVLDARISTSEDGYTLDTWMVLDSNGPGLANTQRNAEIRSALHTVLADPDTTSVPVNRRTPRVLRQFNTRPHVRFHQDPARGCTVLQLVAADRPGLLAQVGRAIGRRGLRIEAAKIATLGERAEDVFFITDAAHGPVGDKLSLKNLARSLTRALKADQDTAPHATYAKADPARKAD